MPEHRTRNVILVAVVASAAQLVASGAAHAQVYDYPPAAEFHGPLSALRLQVQPPQTEVFVDGYYAGTAREFDGVFERLRLDSGEHDIALYLQGHKSVHQKIYLQPDDTFRIRHTMQALASGEAQEPRPIAPPPPPGADPGAGEARRPAGPPMPWPGERALDASARGAGESGFGAIAVRVQPFDAEVLVDGERWDASGPGNRLTIQLPEGSHWVEIRKPGFQPYTTAIQIRRGETATLNVSLAQE